MFQLVAQNLALADAAKRADCDVKPTLKSVRIEKHFVSVDVCYSSKGYCALYEYNTKTGEISLAQD